MNDRKPTPWRDLVAEFRARASGNPEQERGVWAEILSRIDTPLEGELASVPTERRLPILAVVIGIVIGIGIALVLLYTGLVP